MLTTEELKNNTFLGIVEDNADPLKVGRCRIRVFNVFDDIPTDDIPWASPFKDMNGNEFNVPDKGKILTVHFDSGNIYTPEYIYAQHYNINLKKKLEDLSKSDYLTFKSLIFDHKTQIYVNDSEGLKIDHKFNMINIKDTSINLNLKDNMASLNLGCDVAQQRAILGDHFLTWFDEFVQNLLGGPYLGNLGAPVVANPAFIQLLLKYQALKEPKFLSHHVNIVDNEAVNKLDRVADGQIGDNIKTTKKQKQKQIKDLTQREPIKYKPVDGQSTDIPQGANLTPSANANGTVENANPTPDDVAITPSVNDDIQKILDFMKSKNYTIYTRAYEVNIVGVRRQYQGNDYSDAFIDDLYVIYKDDKGNWQKGLYRISTIPGKGIKDPATGKYLPLKEWEATGKGKDRKLVQRTPNLGTLIEGQYKDLYVMGTHLEQRALKTAGKQSAYRDRDKGNPDKITYSTQDTGNLAMYIHAGYYYPAGQANGTKVSNFSEGCQVFKDKNSLDHFFSILDKHIAKGYNKKFTYTLIRATDCNL